MGIIGLRVPLIALCICFSSAFAALPSDNFDDNVMGSLWMPYNDDISKVWLQETNQRLELRSVSNSAGENALYVSAWELSTSVPFEMKINFHYSNTADGDGWVQLGIGVSQDDFIMFGAGYEDYPYFWYEVFSGGEIIDIGGEYRTLSNGTLYVSYNPDIDAIYLSKIGYGSANAMRTITGTVKGTWNAGAIGIWCGGGTDGIEINSGEAYLDNFTVESGTIVSGIEYSSGLLSAWGANDYGQCNVPATGSYVAITAGYNHSLAIKTDGSLVAWGDNNLGQCNVPVGNNFKAIGAGHCHSVALKSDGSLVAWGVSSPSLDNVPEGNDFMAISAGYLHNLALKFDSSIVAWGSDGFGACYAPPGNNFVAVAAGCDYSIALKSDGSLVAWGRNDFGQCNVPSGNNFIAISAGHWHSLALESDGSIVAWGWNDDGQCNVPPGNNYTSIAAGSIHSLALKSDGSLIAWGANWDGQCNVPAGNNFTAIASGWEHNLAIITISGDFDGNGQENLADYAVFARAWISQPGQTNWNPACDISVPKDNIINWLDLVIFTQNWLAGVE